MCRHGTCRFCNGAPGPNAGRSKPGLEAKATTNPLQIAWAAGLYEGEGTAGLHHGGSFVKLAQKDRWVLEQMKLLFGGRLGNPDSTGMSYWSIHGTRARGFLLTVYGLLSPRRQEQARRSFR